MKVFSTMLLIFSYAISWGQNDEIAQPKPTQAQLRWHDTEFYLFTHLGPNTFTDLEWGHGDERAEIFSPDQLDCEQWCRIAKAAGAKGIIITAKHHDGFCLWPSKYSKHTVRESKWKDGKGDILKELAAACKKYELKFGVYLSPWDRNHPDYGTEKYNDVFANMLKEIFTNYSPIWELWWDGANGEGPNGKKQVYDFRRFENLVRSISSGTVIFSDIGPDIRWVGNEKGIAGETNWNLLDTAGFTRGLGAPPTDTLNSGNINGKNWISAECDVSIRPGWFYHKNEDSLVKTGEQLFNLYLKSVGRGATLLLNVPPDGRGLVTRFDSAKLMAFKKLRDDNFANNLANKSGATITTGKEKKKTKKLTDLDGETFEAVEAANAHTINIEFRQPTEVNCIVIKENLTAGQHCVKFRLSLNDDNGRTLHQIEGTTVGRKRIITFPVKKVTSVSLAIEQQKGPSRISEIEAYLVDETLLEKSF